MLAASYEAIVFDDAIGAYEVKVARDAADLLLSLSDGSAEVRIPGWYGANGLTPPTAARFAFDGELDAAALTAAGLELHGTDGDDVLRRLDSYPDALYGEGGDDIIYGGTGDDLLQGGDGADVFVLAPGGGHDTIENPYDALWPSSEDRIRAAPESRRRTSRSPAASPTSRSGCEAARPGSRSGWYRGGARLGGIEFADGTFWNADEMEARFQPAPGTREDDYILAATATT